MCVFVCTAVLLFLCVCVHWCTVCVCVGSSFLRKGTIAVGVNGWMEEKGKKPFSDQEKAFFVNFHSFRKWKNIIT